MNQDIIKMAKECGAYSAANVDGAMLFWSESQVERFFHMAQADMKEKCAKVCEILTPTDVNGVCPVAVAIRAIGDSHD